MAITLESRPESRVITPESILSQAKHALRWNTPDYAAHIQQGLASKISDLEKLASYGSPTNRAEVRHVLAKARHSTTRLRRLGLASGVNAEPSTGMIFGTPTEDPNKDFPEFSNPKAFQWWYLPHKIIEGSFVAGGTPDPYVSRAVQEFLVGNEPPLHQTDIEIITKIYLDPISQASLLRVAGSMKNSKNYGRIPTRREQLIADRLHNGSFPKVNVTNFSEARSTKSESRTA